MYICLSDKSFFFVVIQSILILVGTFVYNLLIKFMGDVTMKRFLLPFIFLFLTAMIYGSAAISQSDAIMIAVKDANVKDHNVVKVELDYDRSKPKYEITFISGNTEYEYEIDSSDGRILSSEKEYNVYGNNSGRVMISDNEALEIALKHAGLDGAKIGKTRIKHDIDDGRKLIEVKFKVKKFKYEYEIDSYSGKIISFEID